MTDQKKKLLIIDDEPAMRHMLRLVLEKEGYSLSEAASGKQALGLLQQEKFDLALCDIRMPEMDGRAFLQKLAQKNMGLCTIMMSAYGTVDTAIECLKLGAYDYISKPFKPDEVVLTLRKAEERLRLQQENSRLKEALARRQGTFSIEDIVCGSGPMREALDQVLKVAGSDSPVLISGETGTGKELVARALHSESPRREEPFLAVNCSAINAGIMESELFGHLKGAFTGAERNKDGLFAAASGGTLFLDEIVELPLDLQPKLLRVLQEGEVRPVGATKTHTVNTRIVAASGVDLREAAAENRFRRDLYYRLAVVELRLPPLRERRADIPLLAEHFLNEIALRDGRPVPNLDAALIRRLTDYSWPGNVRELRNVLEKAMIFSHKGRLEIAALPEEARRHPRAEEGDYSLKKAARRMEVEYIRKTLEHTGGNRTQAAKLLEISLRALIYKIQAYNIDIP